jgi:hypothetical protein
MLGLEMRERMWRASGVRSGYPSEGEIKGAECKGAQIGGGGVVVRDREQHCSALIGWTGGARDMGKMTRIGDGDAPGC